MLTRFRLFLACLVMVAIPLQGLAAASMLFCGMGDAGQAQASGGHDHAAHMHGDSHTGAPVDRHAEAHADHHLDAPSAQEPAGKSASLPDAGHKCGVCAACCHGAAIASVAARPVLAPLPQADLAEPFVLIHGRASAVPDKPPRLARV